MFKSQDFRRKGEAENYWVLSMRHALSLCKERDHVQFHMAQPGFELDSDLFKKKKKSTFLILLMNKRAHRLWITLKSS